jgi:DNA polymerase/3'-5' exonuclease PolX
MKENKKVLLVISVILIFGFITIAIKEYLPIKTISFETSRKVASLSKSELQEAAKIPLDIQNIENMQQALTQKNIWKKLGYTGTQAQNIAQRFKESPKQVQGILSDLANKQAISLKIIIVERPHRIKVSIGTIRPSETEDSLE